MLLISERLKLSNVYTRWILNHPEVVVDVLSVITWLHSNHLIDVEKAKEFIKEASK